MENKIIEAYKTFQPHPMLNLSCPVKFSFAFNLNFNQFPLYKSIPTSEARGHPLK